MDLRLLGGVVWRFKYLVAFGTVVALVFATYSYYSVHFDGYTPQLTPRKEETWQADSTLFLTQPGFPAGRTEQPVEIKRVGKTETAVAKYSDPGRFAGLAPLYARLANSDDVTALMIKTGGPLEGKAKAIPTADTSYQSVNPLPMITIFGTASTPANALRMTRRQTTAFLDYIETQQDVARIGGDTRIELRVINAAGNPLLIVPRKKTLPIVVFAAVLFATLAFAFVANNAWPRVSDVKVEATEATEDSEASEVTPLVPPQDVRHRLV